MKDEKEIIAQLHQMQGALEGIKSGYDKLIEAHQYMDYPIQIMERKIELLIEELENA